MTPKKLWIAGQGQSVNAYERIIRIRRVPQSGAVCVESDAGKAMLDAADARDAGSPQVSVFNDNYEGVERAAIQGENA